VDEGIAVFGSLMADRYSRMPSHYPCVVGVLDRSGRFDDVFCPIEDIGARCADRKTLVTLCSRTTTWRRLWSSWMEERTGLDELLAC
jgi:hypothetical protein